MTLSELFVLKMEAEAALEHANTLLDHFKHQHDIATRADELDQLELEGLIK